MDFDSPSDDNSPKILQLRKWSPSEFPYSPSSFIKGLISPTRKLLLLHSYNFEALLIPLLKDHCMYEKGRHTSSDKTSFSTLESNAVSISGSTENLTSGHSYISDVNSVAWGLCAQTCDQIEETSFQELLFVSGNQGVIVHAFSHYAKSCERKNLAEEGAAEQGTWVEWGPSATLSRNCKVEEESKHHVEDTHAIQNQCQTELPDNVVQKTWLRTLITKVETQKSGGKVHTRFPKRPLYFKNIVVSFRIFDKDSKILEFLSQASPEQSKVNMVSGSDVDLRSSHLKHEASSSSDPRNESLNSVYKCVKIFSSDSRCFVGFTMSLTNPTHLDGSSADNENFNGVLIAVARFVSWGLQWVCSIKLDKQSDDHPLGEWLDFQISHIFVICLRKSGLISFYGSTTGVFVATLDVTTMSRFDRVLSCSNNNGDFRHEKNENSLPKGGSLIVKRRFRRLLMFPHSSLLAVMDECGVIFVLSLDCLIQENRSRLESVFPFQSYTEHGFLLGWMVSAAEIGYQRSFCRPSLPQDLNQLPAGYKSSLLSNLRRNTPFISSQDDLKCWKNPYSSYISTSSDTTHIINHKKLQSSKLLRNVFLPPARCGENDVICCSPFGITHLTKQYKNFFGRIVHTDLLVDFIANDELNYRQERCEASCGEAVGCTLNGFLYLVSKEGISVVLPSVSVPSNFYTVETIGYRLPKGTSCCRHSTDYVYGLDGIKKPWRPWKMEVLDRVLLYEGFETAKLLSLHNGWDLKISQVRSLHMALDFLKFNEIERSLEMLEEVNLAEEGILRLLFAVVYLMFSSASNDTEISASSRLLALGTSFATRVIRKYGLLLHKRSSVWPWYVRGDESVSLSLELTNRKHDTEEHLKRIQEMTLFLVVIRNLQGQLDFKLKKPGQESFDKPGLRSLVVTDVYENQSKLPVVSENSSLLDKSNPSEISHSETVFSNTEDLALIPLGTTAATAPDFVNFDGTSVYAAGISHENRAVQLENPRDMIGRWVSYNLDLKTIVKDALVSGRLPLAVLRLHLDRSHDSKPGIELNDSFNDIRIAGRAIAYDLFLKGEIGLAITTLQKLGEDVETTLKQLLFGTVRRSLRAQVYEEMKKYTYLGPQELRILELASLIERVYPCNSFFSTLASRKNELKKESSEDIQKEISLHLLHPPFNNLIIPCGEIDGVVLGSWTSADEQSITPGIEEDISIAAYWSAAVAWSDAWDQQVIHRVLLDQPLLMGVDIMWDSQLEYHASHNDWQEVSKLLDVIPPYAICSGSLSIRLDGISSAPDIGYKQNPPGYGSCTSLVEELDAVCMDVPNIKVLSFSASTCSMWLRMQMELKLAKKYVFLTDYWHSPEDIVPLLSRSGFTRDMHASLSLDDPIDSLSDSLVVFGDVSVNPDSILALHKVVILFCAKYNLLNLLDIYLDLHNLALDHESLSLLQDATGDNEWAKWLLLLRIKGKEYDGSFSNARAVSLQNLVPGNKLNMLEVDDVMHSVDDIAEGAGEMAAIATLMFAPIPIQECLSSGSVNRNYSSAQCTFESLKPALQRFPTLWSALVAACFGQDTNWNNMGNRIQVPGYSDLSNYLNWREGVFFSSLHDTSILQMIPCWFPKSVRRLIQLYMQGPIGWQSLATSQGGELSMLRDIYYVVNSGGHAHISAISWEAAVQKHIEEELYTSSLEGTGIGVEHHLHRGRALAAFNHLLTTRVHKLKSDTKDGKSETASNGQVNVQSDIQILLAPLTMSEESLISSVIPLAIEHFDDTVLVASCAFILELCGLSANLIQLDVAALRRISSFYKSAEKDHNKQLSPKAPVFYPTSLESEVTETLARALADDYVRDSSNKTTKNDALNRSSNQPSRALLAVLQHLEKASLPSITMGMTCGSWLSSGNGDGADLRSQQKASSEQWKLVTSFCHMHDIPLSTKYLAVLARDNDWVGFLSEAQIGKYPFEVIIQVASKEFSDPCLKIHILTVLKSMQSKKKVVSNSDPVEQRDAFLLDGNLYIPAELFGIIAECEKHESPGNSLLVKAKNLSWSILAMIASCFHDVSPMSCLIAWLEITAARETSAIKVNDLASQIAKNVGASVEATNFLPLNSRTITFHYSRRNSKRRRLVEPIPAESFAFDASQTSRSSLVSDVQGIVGEAKVEKIRDEESNISTDADDPAISLSRMVAVLCEQHLFLPLLQAFEIFLPSCSLLPFIRALQAVSHMRLEEASAHLESFSTRIKEESPHTQPSRERDGKVGVSWISSTAVKAADAMLLACPSPYEKRCLLQLLSTTDFNDGGSAATRFSRLCWKINMAEPSLRSDDFSPLGSETLDDASLLTTFERNGYWDQARCWAKQLEASGESCWRSAANHVTEMQAEAMVTEWKEFLWDVQEQRVALWSHCQTLFRKYSFPALQAGLFFLKHAEAAETDISAGELHELLLLSLQWLSGMITQSNPCYPINLLREIETRVWLLAVESEAQVKSENGNALTYPTHEAGTNKGSNLIDLTANIMAKMDNHITVMSKLSGKNDRENRLAQTRIAQTTTSSFSGVSEGKVKRRPKGFGSSRKPFVDAVDRKFDNEITQDNSRNDALLEDKNFKTDGSLSRWEERVGPAELERAVLSLLDFGQTTAAQQLQTKLSPDCTPTEFLLVDAALKLASLSTPNNSVLVSTLDHDLRNVMELHNLLADQHVIDPLKVLESLVALSTKGSGHGICQRIISVVKSANVLGLSFSEAFEKQPIELLQLLSLKAQDSFDEATLLVRSHSIPAASIAQILAESFLKGLLAAHRGGYMESQKEEGPAPLLWRFSDFLKWAELCPSDSEIGHALMRLVITGQEIPHPCEVELLILSHHFYKSSACLDGVDVLVALAATRVEAYVYEGDFSCLARLITGVGNFYALNFILGILIENGQLDLLLQKYSAAAEANSATAEAVRGFRMAVLTSLKQLTPMDLDAFAMVYHHFDMKQETAALLELRAEQSSQQWFQQYDKDQNEGLLQSMSCFIEAAEVYSSIDAGNKTRKACAQASLVSLQIRMPDTKWLDLLETNARRILVEQSRFQEALIVAEAYGLNQSSEWVMVLWALMLNPELIEQFVAEFVAVLPLQPSMLIELARYYRSEMQARGGQSRLSAWLAGGGLPADWAKNLGKSFRCLLRRTRDFRLKLHLATTATGFGDVINTCNKALDKVPENAGPLILRKGHGGAYVPLM